MLKAFFIKRYKHDFVLSASIIRKTVRIETASLPAQGFTLIELLVVIAIIGLLASIVLASLTSARAKARDARRLSDMHAVKTALEVYADEHGGKYPITSPWQWSTQCAGWSGPGGDDLKPALSPQYLSVMPTDPGMKASVNQDCYLYISNGTDYKFMDYKFTSDVQVNEHPTFIDPKRNSVYWNSHGGAPCTSPGTATSWAIYTEGGKCW